jgi:GrpB-like predicted nucleotidyltransferase (UPF0157 family)
MKSLARGGRNNMILLVDYDPNWPKQFDQEKQQILEALKNWPVSIEHIGSTAVPGLVAKPVIDILVGVSSLDEVSKEFITALESIGYTYMPEHEKEIPERRYFRKNDQSGKRIAQIHVAVKNGPFWHRHIAFRDYLRTHANDMKEYGELKRKLAQQHIDTQDYARAKTEFIKNIEKKIYFLN